MWDNNGQQWPFRTTCGSFHGKKIVHTTTTYRVHAALLGSHAETSFPNWVTICFSLGFPDTIFLANGSDALLGLAKMQKEVPIKPGNCTAEYTGTALLKNGIPLTDENLGMNNMLSHLEEDGLKMHDVVPTLYQRSVRCSLAQLGSQSNEPRTNKDHPIEVHLLSSPATRPPFLHQSAGHLTTRQKRWSCWLPWRQQEPVSAEDCCTGNLPRPKDIPKASSSYDQSLGLLKAC